LTTAIATKIHINPDGSTVEVPADAEIGEHVFIDSAASLGEVIKIGTGSSIMGNSVVSKA